MSQSFDLLFGNKVKQNVCNNVTNQRLHLLFVSLFSVCKFHDSAVHECSHLSRVDVAHIIIIYQYCFSIYIMAAIHKSVRIKH